MSQFKNVLKGEKKQKETVNGPFHLANTLNSKIHAGIKCHSV